MGDEDIEGVVKREVDAARAILREDRILLSNKQIMERLDKHFPEESPQSGDPEPEPSSGSGGEKPPAPEPKPPKETPKKRGIWWGEQTSE